MLDKSVYTCYDNCMLEQTKTINEGTHEDELTPEQLEVILAPNEELATTYITRKIEELEASETPDEEAIKIAKFQLSMVGLSKEDRFTAMHTFIRETGEHASFGNNGDGTLPTPNWEVDPGHFIAQAANLERWYRLGIDRESYDEAQPYQGAASHAESSWADARRAQSELAAAQHKAQQALDTVAYNFPVQ